MKQYHAVAAYLGIAAVLLTGCAGRNPQPIALSQSSDGTADCIQLAAEIRGNEARAAQLAAENRNRNIGNTAAVVGGLLLWPVLFAMDLKGAAKIELEALKARTDYLTDLQARRGCLDGSETAGAPTAREPAALVPAALPPPRRELEAAGAPTTPARELGLPPEAPIEQRREDAGLPQSPSAEGVSPDAGGECAAYVGDPERWDRCALITGVDRAAYVPIESWGADLDDLVRCHPVREAIAEYEACLAAAG